MKICELMIAQRSKLTVESESLDQYNNWIRYTPDSLKLDFDEYKKKELSKWKRRAETIGTPWPMFDTIQDFKSALDQASIVDIDQLEDVDNLTYNHSIDSIKQMVGAYQKPRDVDRIIQGFKENAQLPLPIILKGDHGMWIMAGNTRQSTARVMGIDPKALLVDLSS